MKDIDLEKFSQKITEKIEKQEKKEEKNKLNPIAESKGFSMSSEQVNKLASAFSEKNVVIESNASGSQDLDNLFSSVLKELSDTDNIDMNTEYTDENQIFATATGNFLGKVCNVPIISSFLTAYDRRMVSKGRKGRTEKILALQRRQEAEIALAYKNNLPDK